MNMIDLSELYEAPIDPAALDFTTKPGRACRSCIFERQMHISLRQGRSNGD